MTSTSPTATATGTASRRHAGRAFQAHLRNETRLLIRDPGVLVFGATMPLAAIIVMCFFAGARRPLDELGGFSVIQTYVPVLVLFATSILGLTVIPSILGGYREMGVLRRLRTTPASPATLLAALFVIVTLMGLLVSAVIVLIPLLVGVALPAHLGWFVLAGCLSLMAFVSLGTVLAAVVPNPKAAAGFGNLLAAVMWFAAGLWFPRAQFPDWLTVITDLTPGGAAADVMLEATHGLASSWGPLAVLAAWVVGGVAIAILTFKWE